MAPQLSTEKNRIFLFEISSAVCEFTNNKAPSVNRRFKWQYLSQMKHRLYRLCKNAAGYLRHLCCHQHRLTELYLTIALPLIFYRWSLLLKSKTIKPNWNYGKHFVDVALGYCPIIVMVPSWDLYYKSTSGVLIIWNFQLPLNGLTTKMNSIWHKLDKSSLCCLCEELRLTKAIRANVTGPKVSAPICFLDEGVRDCETIGENMNGKSAKTCFHIFTPPDSLLQTQLLVLKLWLNLSPNFALTHNSQLFVVSFS